jgi:tRNA-splicing ligase RtcB (3'-phosphate/5'-hydroxy nucleic acid ligase)
LSEPNIIYPKITSNYFHVPKSLEMNTKQQIFTGDDLLAMGYQPGPTIGVALKTLRKAPQITMTTLQMIRQQPADYAKDPVLGALAKALIAEAQAKAAAAEVVTLREAPLPYTIYGAEQIEAGALQQMNTAMQLPVTVAGALMPDAHQGYGLPIGGVLATRGVVIPYGVGVDIGCRMALTVFDIPEAHFFDHRATYKRELIAHTAFGAGNGFKGKDRAYHQVLDDKAFGMNRFVRDLHDKAAAQLGSSGGGNHFVEWGIIEFEQPDADLGVPAGRFVALLTHSGSRGFGATIAGHYTRIAKEQCKLPAYAANLAWLDLQSEEGQAYWMAMNLAGDYASACHEVIHRKLTKAMGGTVLARVENHHNFAWKEIHNGEEVIVHRKGATPAGKGVMGIIPGSMTAPGFLVRGRGVADSIGSASHGAGRQMSRTQAIKNVAKNTLREHLQTKGVTLIGGGLDEAPMAYKDIHTVMAAQQDLIDVVARFTPKMVRMADDGSRED